MRSGSGDDDVSEQMGKKTKQDDLISKNITAILSNGIHCSYLLNTMTNPLSLPYSNYALGGAAQKSNHIRTKKPAHSTKHTNNNMNTNTNNMNLLYNYQYPQPQPQPHYHLFQQQPHQHIGNNMSQTTSQLRLNPYHHPNSHYYQPQIPTTSTATPAPVSTPIHSYILNPYDPSPPRPTNVNTTSHTSHTHIPYTPHTPQTQQSVNTHQNNNNNNSVIQNDSISNKEMKERNRRNNEIDTNIQIVSIPDEFASAINNEFSEMIGMQENIHMNHVSNDINVSKSADQSNNEIKNEINTEIKKEINNEINSEINNEINSEINIYENEEFIAKRKQQIIRFLQSWDTEYPVTSENGETINKKENNYNFPPGLTHPKVPKQGQPNDMNISNVTEGEESILPSTEPTYYFDPPSYVFGGTFEEALVIGAEQNKWIMLNIQDTDWFSAQWANPLIWKHKRYGLIIKQNFIFFNVIRFADNLIGLIHSYNLKNEPSVCIINPYSNLKIYQFTAPSTSASIINLRKELLNIVNTYPCPSVYNDSLKHVTDSTPVKPTKPPIPHKYNVIDTSSSDTNSNEENSSNSSNSNTSLDTSQTSQISQNTSGNYSNSPHTPQPQIQPQHIPNENEESIENFQYKKNKERDRHRNRNRNVSGRFHFTSSLDISSEPHIYCCEPMDETVTHNMWNLKASAYVLSTRQTFDWNDWMLILSKCSKIIGAIPSEQHIEFLRNRNGAMTLESSGTYNGWWSEKRIAEFVVNEKFGLTYEGGFASENGRERKKFLKSLELPRRPTFKKMLVIIPNFNNDDKILFHDNSLSITSFLEYDKMDNITSFQLWLSFITYLSVNMFEHSNNLNNNLYNECTNFCIKLGSKWKLPLTTLYNDIESLISNTKCRNVLFSHPKIATDATTQSFCSQSTHMQNIKVNKYHHSIEVIKNNDAINIQSNQKQQPGLQIAFLKKSNNNSKYFDSKRVMYIKSFNELEISLNSIQKNEILDFPFPLFSSGWFSFNTLSSFASILEQHLNGTWVSMYSLNSRKQFKQIFDINKNIRRRPIVYSKLLQQQINEENYKNNYIQLLTNKLTNIKNKQRLISFWNENKLYWTDLIIDKSNKNINNSLNSLNFDDSQSLFSLQTQNMNDSITNSNEDEYDENKILHKNHNKRNYRKKRKQRFRNRSKRKQNNKS